jgi:cytochrome c oxidase subunit I+III
VGAFIPAGGVMVFIVNVFLSIRQGARAGENPWGADTLEWATESPPPAYNFRHVPTVSGPHPLWEAGWAEQPKVVGLRPTHREVLVTDLMDAEPQSRMILPGPTYIPFLAAVAVSTGFIGVMFVEVLLLVALIPTYVALVAWNWPRMAHQVEPEGGREHRLARGEGKGLTEAEGEVEPRFPGDEKGGPRDPGGGA